MSDDHWDDDSYDDEDAWADDGHDSLGDDESLPCPECGGEVPEISGRCPACGYWITEVDRRSHPSASKPLWIRLTAAIVLLSLLAGLLALGSAFF